MEGSRFHFITTLQYKMTLFKKINDLTIYSSSFLKNIDFITTLPNEMNTNLYASKIYDSVCGYEKSETHYFPIQK